jgi:hypothetical protein
MTKKLLIIISFAIVSIIGIAAINSNSPASSPAQVANTINAPTEKVAGVTESKTNSFTKDELSVNNGKNGKPCYVAIENKVYDASRIINLPIPNGPKIECGTILTPPQNDQNRPDISQILTQVGTFTS